MSGFEFHPQAPAQAHPAPVRISDADRNGTLRRLHNATDGVNS